MDEHLVKVPCWRKCPNFRQVQSLQVQRRLPTGVRFSRFPPFGKILVFLAFCNWHGRYFILAGKPGMSNSIIGWALGSRLNVIGLIGGGGTILISDRHSEFGNRHCLIDIYIRLGPPAPFFRGRVMCSANIGGICDETAFQNGQGATRWHAISPLLKDITIGALTTNIYLCRSFLADPVRVILYPPPLLIFETSICPHTGWSQLRFVFLIRHRSVIATPRFTVCPLTLSISDDRLLNSEAAPPLNADPTYWNYIQFHEVLPRFVRLFQHTFMAFSVKYCEHPNLLCEVTQP